MIVLTRGNRFRGQFTLTEDTRIEGGNWILCQVDPNGCTLTVAGGNVRGLKGPDGQQIDPTNPPSWCVVERAWGPYPYVWRRYEPLPQALAIVDALRQAGGQDAVDAWLWDVGYVLAAPAGLTYITWRDAHAAWSDANGNLIYSAAAFRRVAAFLLGKPLASVSVADWPTLRDLLRQHDLATWSAEPTQTAEEHA